MPEHEAILIVIELLALSDQYAESLWRNVDIWVGLSIGLVILSYSAPDKLNYKTGSILVTLYTAYSLILVEKTFQLLESMNLSRDDALRIAGENDLLISTLDAVSGSSGSVNGNLIMFFFFGTFLSAAGFVFYSCRRSAKES